MVLIMKIENIEKFNQYVSSQPQWEKYSAIRTRPRRLITDEENPGHYFPPSRQPILAHPKMMNIEDRVKRFILAQSLCKYMNDIANIETDIINKAAYGITKDHYKVKFNSAMKRDALSIIIDESYHAYVALDFMQQIADFEKIVTLDLPTQSNLSQAIKTISAELPENLVKSFEIISVCIAEHALTNDLIAVAKSKDVCKTFYYVMHDHMLDETRHAKFFEKILAIYWNELEESEQHQLSLYLPRLISLYMCPALQSDFDKSILLSVGINEHDAEEIVNTTHFGWSAMKIDQNNIIAKQMIDLLKRVGLFEHERIVLSFKSYGIES